MTQTAAAGAALIWCPFPDCEQAQRIVDILLSERLIACADLVPDLQSVFSWHGERGSGPECGALLKTTSALLSRAMQRLEALHPYETPAITGWPVLATAATADWLTRETAATQ